MNFCEGALKYVPNFALFAPDFISPEFMEITILKQLEGTDDSFVCVHTDYNFKKSRETIPYFKLR